MVNIVESALSREELGFIEEIASLLVPRGMPVSYGRVYAYLLLKQERVSVDQIAADLRMSRVGAWKAARNLEGCGNVRRYGEPGSKRALYGADEDLSGPMLEQCALMGAMAKILRNSAATIAKGEAAGRLRAMADFYSSLRQTMEEAVQALSAGRAGKAEIRQLPPRSAKQRR